ncbi:recombinase family protein [Erysipelothrix rhusiopathiae]|uniref:recombinase family protein n=1 Tax=Erysipelothrix rhusiopathiae TaxID=1648 RepID=UPI0023B17D1B|nr:recombinase family protein [Erysipelothrix rhusiopathiae]MDE8041749.1 recombinase family protein [Erysipelothrix rhusiopathiae]MDE8049231.1 recombinase family protein [Erysipelothrix rhusiopathiae]MDE8057885.1 recombinase family protein [Erysipelothrix rhusiopathiae]MDE8066660.1 recombinase family protein [Erysipelothrix rhusiopathiae]
MERKIAIYCRVSTDDQAENGYNLREQEKRIEQYINAYDNEFTEYVIKYIDDGYSAKDLKRKEMKLLLEDIQQGMISKVIIHNLDRLTRSMKDLIYLIELFEKYDVQLFSLKEKIDTKTAIGRFFVSMIILIAQWEREAISERTIRALDQSAYEGNYVHGRAPFGYSLVNKKLVINEKEATIIKQIYHMYYYNEDSMNKILHYHGSHHRDLGFVWTYDRIRIILTNEIYTGTYRNKRISIDNHSPQIISHELFEMVQKLMKSKNRRDNHSYLFKSLCVDYKTGKPLNHKSVVKTSATYLYYENNKKERINQNDVELQTRNTFDEYIAEELQKSISIKIATLKKRDYGLKEIDHYFDIGFIDEEYYSEQKNKMINNIKSNEIVLNEIANEVLSWTTMTDRQRRKFLLMNVEHIFIDLRSKKVEKVIFKNSK